MKFTVEREHLLKPLQQVSGPLGGRPTLPILGNLLLQVADGALSLTGTDLEMEMVARVALVQPHEAGATTVPARKFFDICRGLPEGAEIAVQLEGDRMLVRSGRSRFSLSTLPAADFPNLDDWQSEVEFTLPQATMKRLIEATQFSMAHQDVRYYLNGMLFETEGSELRTVCPLRAWKVCAPTKRCAFSVIATRTSAPASRRRRTRSAALYAAIPPQTQSNTR